MSNKKRLAVIDIGGSSLKGYICHEKTSSELIVNRRWKPGEYNFEAQAIETAKEIKTNFEYNELIIGIPGPVDRKKDYVFCPPLNKKLSLKKLREVSNLVVNDVVCQIALLLNSPEFKAAKDKHALITIGTSLGLCVFEVLEDTYETLLQANSYEIAHEFLDSWDLMIDRENIENILDNVRPRICSVFSAGGFAAYMGGEAHIKNQYMLSTDKSELTRILESKNNPVYTSKVSAWFKELRKLCDSYLRKNGMDINAKNFNIRGGIMDALIESKIYQNPY